MKQQTLAIAADQSESFERYRRPTWRDEFLATMGRIVPWAELCEVIEPHYPKAGNGRPPIGLERVLRLYFVQPGRLEWQLQHLCAVVCMHSPVGWSGNSNIGVPGTGNATTCRR